MQVSPEECIDSSKMLQNVTLGSANFGGIGSIGRIRKNIPVNIEPKPILSRSNDYGVYIK